MTNGKDREDILRKIRGCFARADGARNDNEHERATALRQANALMSKYAVELEELGATDELGEVGQTDSRVGSVVWKRQVFFVLGPLYGCQVLWNNKGTMYVIGRQHYRNVVADMAEYVVTSIDREANRRGGGKTYLNSFRKGAVEGVRSSVDEILAERARAAEVVGAPGTALVLVDHFKTEMQRSSEYVRAKYKVGKARRSPGAKDYRGYAAGHEHGSGINLNDQLGSSGGGVKGRLS